MLRFLFLTFRLTRVTDRGAVEERMSMQRNTMPRSKSHDFGGAGAGQSSPSAGQVFNPVPDGKRQLAPQAGGRRGTEGATLQSPPRHRHAATSPTRPTAVRAGSGRASVGAGGMAAVRLFDDSEATPQTPILDRHIAEAGAALDDSGDSAASAAPRRSPSSTRAATASAALHPSFVFMQMHSFPTVGGAPCLIPPSDVLDRAINILDLIPTVSTHKVGCCFCVCCCSVACVGAWGS